MRHFVYIVIFNAFLQVSVERTRGRIILRRKRRLKGQDSGSWDDSEIALRANMDISEVELFEGDIIHDEFVDAVYGFDKPGKRRKLVDDTRRSGADDNEQVLPVDDMLDNLSQDRRPVPLYPDCPTSNRRKRAATIGTSRLWEDGVIHYEFDPSISPEKLAVIKAAISHWEANTCLRFQPRRNERDYLSFYNGAGCFTTVGMRLCYLLRYFSSSFQECT